MDFQNTLMRLRDKLEAEHHFHRSNLIGGKPISQSTDQIAIFLAWLENTPAAQKVLKDLDRSNFKV
jgi:hypothetical protein